jgi:hypothetical protein
MTARCRNWWKLNSFYELYFIKHIYLLLMTDNNNNNYNYNNYYYYLITYFMGQCPS